MKKSSLQILELKHSNRNISVKSTKKTFWSPRNYFWLKLWNQNRIINSWEFQHEFHLLLNSYTKQKMFIDAFIVLLCIIIVCLISLKLQDLKIGISKAE